MSTTPSPSVETSPSVAAGTATGQGAPRDGILSGEGIAALARAGGILPASAFAADQIQPASLDLR
ncbi:2'-deoxycytidine 5'-triphosphate deaminase, partial [Methylobacterium sp. WL6]|uniref:2'-deoxycytidine 5'-triphosphate deaminase domain-containing protein n=3 Tax=Methylobacterium TaxID=407 RepID=UPI0011DA26C0